MGHSSIRLVGNGLLVLCGLFVLLKHSIPPDLPRAALKWPTFTKDIFRFHFILAVKLCVFFQCQTDFKMEEGDNVMIKRLDQFKGSF